VLEVGQSAPDFKLPSTAGPDPLELSAELPKHRATIVAFYVFDFTPG
jgi:peroxiredoxin